MVLLVVLLFFCVQLFVIITLQFVCFWLLLSCFFVSYSLWLSHYNLCAFSCCFLVVLCHTFGIIRLHCVCFLFGNTISENICIYSDWRWKKVCILFLYVMCRLFAEYSAKSLIVVSIVLSIAKYLNAFHTAISPKHITSPTNMFFSNETYYHQ